MLMIITYVHFNFILITNMIPSTDSSPISDLHQPQKLSYPHPIKHNSSNKLANNLLSSIKPPKYPLAQSHQK